MTDRLSPLSGHDLVCVSVMDWDWPFWTSRQQLMSRLARTNRVLFVDPPLTFASDYLGIRSDLRLRRKLHNWVRNGGISRRGEGLLTWSPPPSIPFNRIRNRRVFDGLLDLNQRVFRLALLRTMDRLGFRKPILWVSFNVYFGDAVVGRLGESLSVYHCTDEISGFPGYSPFITEIEARVAARSDLVLASSDVLRESKSRYNPASHFVPNGADVELFEQAEGWQGAPPHDLLRLPPPRAGFVGQIEYRFDVDLLRQVAEMLPNWSFALIGPVQEGNREVETLRGIPNVHFLGLKERHRLPGYLAHLQVTLIPYKINRLTRGIYPLKLHEYLASGKPVVATPIPSLMGMGDTVYVAGDAPSFASAIERAVKEDSEDRRRARTLRAREESWEARVSDIGRLLRAALETKGGGRAAAPPPPHRSSGSVAIALAPSPNTNHSGARALPASSFLRLGRELANRHAGLPKRLAYQLIGDLNLHRRVRGAHVLGVVKRLNLAGAELLDAGCGEGACTIALARELEGCTITGVDVSPTSVAACQMAAGDQMGERLRFEQADVTCLPYQERFAGAVCVDVLEHISDDEAALRSIHKALRPGGTLVLHVPMRHQLQRRFLPTHNGHHVTDHVRDEYLREEIVDKVERAGFQVEEVRCTFGAAGELAFELNTLLPGIPAVRELLAAITYPLALTLAYLDVARGPGPSGNSFLIVASKPVAGNAV
ncbi:MAG: methyltransferase domain-containing protein [Sphingomonadaceae bacterium]